MIPRPVAAYLARALPADRPAPRQVELEQEGQMWLEPGARPRRFTARERLAVDCVAFAWRARFRLAPLLALTVVDGYAGGAGSLEMRVLGVRLQRQEGAEMSEGDAWVPTPWGGEFADYRELGGLRMPARAQVFWDLPDGRFVYWSGRVTSARTLAAPFEPEG